MLTAPRTVDNIRGAEAEAEPVYDATDGRPLAAEVVVMLIADAENATEVELLWSIKPKVIEDLDELLAEEAADAADEFLRRETIPDARWTSGHCLDRDAERSRDSVLCRADCIDCFRGPER